MLRRCSVRAGSQKKSQFDRIRRFLPQVDELEVRVMLSPVVSITAQQPNASEQGPTWGVFSVVAQPSSPSVRVYYSVSGTATNAVDYDSIADDHNEGNVLVTGSSGNLNIRTIDDHAALPRRDRDWRSQ